MKLDKDGSGSIDKEEFLAIPQIATNPLASRLIAIMDEDGGGDVDFKEFIAGLSAFSNKGNKVEKLRCKSTCLFLSKKRNTSSRTVGQILTTSVTTCSS